MIERRPLKTKKSMTSRTTACTFSLPLVIHFVLSVAMLSQDGKLTTRHVAEERTNRDINRRVVYFKVAFSFLAADCLSSWCFSSICHRQDRVFDKHIPDGHQYAGSLLPTTPPLRPGTTPRERDVAFFIIWGT